MRRDRNGERHRAGDPERLISLRNQRPEQNAGQDVANGRHRYRRKDWHAGIVVQQTNAMRVCKQDEQASDMGGIYRNAD